MTQLSASVPTPAALPFVLLVERDADIRQMYAEFLRQSTRGIEEAQDGREALEKAIRLKPDVIVAETRLPGIDGLALCRLLKHDDATRNTPFVFVTGDGYQTDIARAQKAGADAVLVKPCLPERLAAEIHRVVSRARELRAHGGQARAKADAEIARSTELIDRARANVRRVALSRAYLRRDTTTPPNDPPALVCPVCDEPLTYLRSHVGGVSERHQEQWDYFECPTGCGEFQYRQRTRKLRQVG